MGYCWSYGNVISLTLQACGAQGNLGYIKKEKHTVVGKQNVSLYVSVCVRNGFHLEPLAVVLTGSPALLK